MTGVKVFCFNHNYLKLFQIFIANSDIQTTESKFLIDCTMKILSALTNFDTSFSDFHLMMNEINILIIHTTELQMEIIELQNIKTSLCWSFIESSTSIILYFE